ncbi:cupin domain-containing protein [Mycobacterium sp. 4D054]|uniref:cupin domain-containing protein n=1 Tax=Mycobacterium sp. 4D054 TaxID=3457440 RepID=UPI003FCF1E48
MKHVVPVTAALIAAILAPASAGATPPDGDIERTDLAQGTTGAPVVIISVGQPTTLYVQDLVLHSPASSGWHTHPGPEHTVINEGTVYVQSAPDCIPVAYPAGQAVFIPAGVPHVVRNDAPAACP